MKTETEILPDKTYWASFNRFELRILGAAIADCSHSGHCDDDVDYWAPRIARPECCTAAKLRAELTEYGAWDADELADDAENWKRIVWIACGNILDSDEPDCSDPVT